MVRKAVEGHRSPRCWRDFRGPGVGGALTSAGTGNGAENAQPDAYDCAEAHLPSLGITHEASQNEKVDAITKSKTLATWLTL
jgi:hypothetical protein